MSNSATIGAHTPCSDIEEVDRRWGRLRYMKIEQARFLRDFLKERDARDLLELGFFQGKSTAFMAAILEELGRGHVTTMDLVGAKKRNPSITDVLSDLNLEHRVTPIFSHRSFTWELHRLLAETPRPQFD